MPPSKEPPTHLRGTIHSQGDVCAMRIPEGGICFSAEGEKKKKRWKNTGPLLCHFPTLWAQLIIRSPKRKAEGTLGWLLLHLFLRLFVLVVPTACGSSQARDPTQATPATRATAVTTLDPTEPPGNSCDGFAETVSQSDGDMGPD